jgi:two-component system alkaline phosphatase synthesis response regulator PhoP
LRERRRSGIVCGQSTLGGRMARAVLIVDDEQHIRLLIEQTLEELLDEDVDLYTAADGDEALAAIAAQRPALVFLDVMMPGRSGLDVCRAVRADPELAGAHIVLLTAKGQAQDRAEGLAAGADEFLTKPFDPDALLALARGVLGLA